MLRYLQGWIGLVGFIALGNTVSCFTGHLFLSDLIYTESPSEATALAARLFGIWTLLSGLLRIGCASCIKDRAIYNLTFLSFVLALLHFLLEVFVYKTAVVTTYGVISPLIVSSVSIVWMAIGYSYLPDPYASPKTSRKTSRYDGPLQMEDMLQPQNKKLR